MSRAVQASPSKGGDLDLRAPTADTGGMGHYASLMGIPAILCLIFTAMAWGRVFNTKRNDDLLDALRMAAMVSTFTAIALAVWIAAQIL